MPLPEVRLCRRCRAPAVLLATDWTHTGTFGGATGLHTRDYRCQACGAAFTIRPRARLLGYAIAGVLLLPTCIGAVPLIFVWWAWKQDAWNPVVPGATPPAVKYPPGPPLRRCGACRAPAVVEGVVRHSTNGLPTGVETTYRCTGCARTFVVESPWGHVFNTFASGMVALIGVALVGSGSSWAWRFGAGGLALLAAGLLGAQSVLRLVNRVRNPVAEV